VGEAERRGKTAEAELMETGKAKEALRQRVR
jgi:hypothetical protein